MMYVNRNIRIHHDEKAPGYMFLHYLYVQVLPDGGNTSQETDTHAYAQSSGLLTIPSGRSGGAVGDIVADLALALEAPISKNGAPKSGERLDKINSLLRASSDNPASHLWNLTEVFYPLCLQHA